MSAPGKPNQWKALLAVGVFAIAALGGGAWLASREYPQDASPGAHNDTVNPGDAVAPDMAQGSAGDGAPAPAETFADQRAWSAADESAWSDAPHEPAQIAVAAVPWKSGGAIPIALPPRNAAFADSSGSSASAGSAGPARSVAPPADVVDVASQRFWNSAQEAKWQAVPHAPLTIALAQTPWSTGAARPPGNKPNPATAPATAPSPPRAGTIAPSGISPTPTQSR